MIKLILIKIIFDAAQTGHTLWIFSLPKLLEDTLTIVQSMKNFGMINNILSKNKWNEFNQFI